MRRGVGLAGRSAAAALRTRAAGPNRGRGPMAGGAGPIRGSSVRGGTRAEGGDRPEVRVRAPAGAAGTADGDRLEIRLELAGRPRTLLRPRSEPLAKPLAKLRRAAAAAGKKPRKPAKKNRHGSGGEADRTPGARRVVVADADAGLVRRRVRLRP